MKIRKGDTVLVIAGKDKGKPVRVGYRVEADGTKVRVARPSGEVIK